MLDIDLAEASRSDMLKHTVSTTTVVQTATEAFCSRRYRLVEAAAGASPRRCWSATPRSDAFASPCISRTPRSAATFDDVGVVIERARQERTKNAARAELWLKRSSRWAAMSAMCAQPSIIRHRDIVRRPRRAAEGAVVGLPDAAWGVSRPAAFHHAVIAVSDHACTAPASSPRPSLRTRARPRPAPANSTGGPRTIDLDILVYDDLVLNDATLTTAPPASVRARRSYSCRLPKSPPRPRHRPGIRIGARGACPSRYEWDRKAGTALDSLPRVRGE